MAKTYSRVIAAVLMPVLCHAAADVCREGADWILENPSLKVNVAAETAWIRVLHKETGTLWQQESPADIAQRDEKVHIRRAPGPMTIDGADTEWSPDHYVWLPWVGEDGERNLSGGARLMWDDKHIYLYVRVRDDNVAFGGESAERWWEADSVEFWFGSVQIGLHLAPGHVVAADPRGGPCPDATIAVKMITEGRLPGYAVELALPVDTFSVLRDPAPGVRVSFAIGLNDADPQPGEPTKRVAQGYYPRSWVHSVPETFAVAVLTDSSWDAPERNADNDRSAGPTSGQAAEMGPGGEPDTLQFATVISRGQLKPVPLRVELALVGDDPALDMRLSCPEGRDAPMRTFSYPSALYPPDPGGYFLGVADYCDGRYVPVGDKLFRNKRLVTFGGDLPFVTVTDGGQGLVAITMTPFDAAIQMQSRLGDPERLGFPGFSWLPTKGTFGEQRSGRLVFFAQGGHVSACKIYRRVAREQGFFKTLREKAEANPDVHKLMGAVNWWGAHGLKFVREAVAAGMTHGLVNGRSDPKDMAEMIKLGWLVGEYDNYEDIDDSPTIARAKAPVAEHAVVKPDGELMTAWISRDNDMNPTHTYMKQCTGRMLKSAKIVIPHVLETYPYNTRFLDVTTATSVKECYSPAHPTDRTTDMRYRQALGRYVSEELGLVKGGEHGRFWDTPYTHYHEGMMGGGMYTWPAGYLRDVKEREELGERYLNYGINPAARAPLFELVYHDCVVNYWYWGACSDYLHQVAPELTDRKTAMNVLYGTPPMMWVNAHGLRWSVPADREKMVEIYRNVCKVHEVVGLQEMLSHAFLSDDRMLQQTVFEDGTTCTANFGKTPCRVDRRGDAQGQLELGENDFYVWGPKIEQWRCGSGADTLNAARQQTFIRTSSYVFIGPGAGGFTESGLTCSGKTTIRESESGRIHLDVGAGASMELRLNEWRAAATGQPRMLLQLGETGKALKHLPLHSSDIIKVAAPIGRASHLLLLIGKQAQVPDVTVQDLILMCNGELVEADSQLPAGSTLSISATVANLGLAPAEGLELAITLDSASGMEILRQVVPRLEPGAPRRISAEFGIERADGQRRIVTTVIGDDALFLTGAKRTAAAFTSPLVPESFALRQRIRISIPEGDPAGMPVEMPLSLRSRDGASAIDPGNLRALFADGAVVPAQFETAAEGRSGTVVFCLPSGLTPSSQVDATLLGLREGDRSIAPHYSSFEVAEDGAIIRMRTYQARLGNGILSSVVVFGDGNEDIRVMDQLIVSSKETGWSKEDGAVEHFACEQRGPVRAVFSCTKLVAGTYRLTRTWVFYADRFEVHSQSTPVLHTLTRAFYATPGKAVNATGREAQMDGSGDAEEFGFKGTPQWYAILGENYSTACIALTEPAGFVYWDGGRMGQISLSHATADVEKRVYLWGPGRADATFAEAVARSYETGVSCAVAGE